METNPHAFGDKWRVIEHVSVALPHGEITLGPEMYVDRCFLNRKKKAASERMCNKLRIGKFKGMYHLASLIIANPFMSMVSDISFKFRKTPFCGPKTCDQFKHQWFSPYHIRAKMMVFICRV